MTRLQPNSYPHGSVVLRRTTVRSAGAFLSDSEIAAADARVREQEAHVLRLIVQGAPTQMAEDVLRHLMDAAEAIRVRKGLPRE